MEILRSYGKENLARVFLGLTSLGNEVEFVESTQPPKTFDEKQVVIVSTMVGCPIGCKICDAGSFYIKKLSEEEIIEQIDYVLLNRWNSFFVPSKYLKIQFARTGEPSLNKALLSAIVKISSRYRAQNLVICVSTIAPRKSSSFFEELLKIKKSYYNGKFQLQFSIHSTDEKQRNSLIPVPVWSFEEIRDYSLDFIENVDRKVTLNFAIMTNSIIDVSKLYKYFDSDKFIIKITPVNPTYRAIANNIISGFDTKSMTLPFHPSLIKELKEARYEVILSVGELEENKIGTNCGQLVKKHFESGIKIDSAYTYIPKEYVV